MSLYCNCPDWEPNIKIVSAPLILQAVRSGGKYQYTGKRFVFCPWCSNRLVEKCDACGALLMPGEQAEGHYIEGPCKRPDPPRSGCQRCGRPCFGSICAECKGERPPGGSVRSA